MPRPPEVQWLGPRAALLEAVRRVQGWEADLAVEVGQDLEPSPVETQSYGLLKSEE